MTKTKAAEMRPFLFHMEITSELKKAALNATFEINV